MEDIQPKIAPGGIENSEFRDAAHKLVDIIVDYFESMKKDKSPIPNVKPGFMRERVPENPPETKEQWQEVFKDIDNVVLDGNMHWSAGNNFGYFATGFSYPSLLGDMLCGAASAIGFTWASSPACTELETVMMDWLAKAINLPKCFLHDGKGPGGGVIQVTASDSTLMTLLAARSNAIQQEMLKNPGQTRHEIVGRLVAYASKCSHSSVERAGLIALIEMRLLDFDENISLRGKVLQEAIDEDRKRGKIPIYVCATMGTTACCSFDNIAELSSVCKKENMWLHVDAAFAGSALLCPEFQYLAQGLEEVTSFNFNPHKWMMVSFDCSALWVRNSNLLVNAFNLNPVYLRHDEQQTAIDYRHWQIPLGRRFRSIKLWFVMRMIGLDGLRSHIRKGVALSKHFENLLRSDNRFEIMFSVTLALVCFRLVIPNVKHEILNDLNRMFHSNIQKEGKFLITPSTVNDEFFLRVSTGVNNCSIDHLENCWKSLQEKASETLAEFKIQQ